MLYKKTISLLLILLSSTLIFFGCDDDGGTGPKPTPTPTQPPPTPTIPTTPSPTPTNPACPEGMVWVGQNNGCIDIYEYPNVQGVVPQTSVTWYEAADLCSARGARLCSKPEWARACAGPANYQYPYGDLYDPTACNGRDAGYYGLAPSGSFPKCVSYWGAYDLTGNAWEWTGEPYGEGYMYMGGSFEFLKQGLQCDTFLAARPGARFSDVGFRCCWMQ